MNTMRTYHARLAKQSHPSGPICMGTVARFVALKLRREQIDRAGDDQLQPVDLSASCALSPLGRQLPQDRLRHQIDMPAVSALKLAANDSLVTAHGHLLAVGYWVSVHAGLGELSMNPAIVSVPQQGGRTDQNH